MGNLNNEAEQKINKLQEKFKYLNKECTYLTTQKKKILECLNLDNMRLNKDLSLISKKYFKTIRG
jgi:hypothetical protein